MCRRGIEHNQRAKSNNSGPSCGNQAIRLALYQPDRPHNLGAIMRYTAAFGVPLDIVEPCGFPLDDRRIRQGALDYLQWLDYTRHRSFSDFLQSLQKDNGSSRRLVLLTTRGLEPYHRFPFNSDDVLLLGSESSGVPDHVHETVDARITIPMIEGPRSLNVATAGVIVLSEALRQLGAFDQADR